MPTDLEYLFLASLSLKNIAQEGNKCLLSICRCQTSWSMKVVGLETKGVLLICGLREVPNGSRPLAGWEPSPTNDMGRLGGQPNWGESLRVSLTSPQVSRGFRVHLVSRVLWGPKVSPVSRMVPRGAASRMGHRGPGAGIPDSPKPLFQACAGVMGPERGLSQRGPHGSGLGLEFLLHGVFGATFPSVFNGPILWPQVGE